MNLTDLNVQKTILDIAISSESQEVADACKIVIKDYLDNGDFEIDNPQEIISIAIECVGLNDSELFNNLLNKPLIASLKMQNLGNKI